MFIRPTLIPLISDTLVTGLHQCSVWERELKKHISRHCTRKSVAQAQYHTLAFGWCSFAKQECICLALQNVFFPSCRGTVSHPSDFGWCSFAPPKTKGKHPQALAWCHCFCSRNFFNFASPKMEILLRRHSYHIWIDRHII